MSKEDKYLVPKEANADVLHAMVKGAVSGAPVLGGVAAELFSLVISPPLQKRQIDWMNEVAEGLRELEDRSKDFDVEKLKDNEQFVSAVLCATQAVVRSHQNEKREALRNAILNVAIGSGLTEDQESIFIYLIDHYTAWHLCILRLFQAPLELAKEKGITQDKYYMGSRSQLLEDYFPDMKKQGQFYNIVVSELKADGMLNADLTGLITAQGMFQKITTEWADRFLKFISTPN